jgi:hypothetical protein
VFEGALDAGVARAALHDARARMLPIGPLCVLTGNLLPLSEVLVQPLDAEDGPSAAGGAACGGTMSGAAAQATAQPGAMPGCDYTHPWRTPSDVPPQHWVWVLKQLRLDPEEVRAGAALLCMQTFSSRMPARPLPQQLHADAGPRRRAPARPPTVACCPSRKQRGAASAPSMLNARQPSAPCAPLVHSQEDRLWAILDLYHNRAASILAQLDALLQKVDKGQGARSTGRQRATPLRRAPCSGPHATTHLWLAPLGAPGPQSSDPAADTVTQEELLPEIRAQQGAYQLCSILVSTSVYVSVWSWFPTDGLCT